VVTVAPMAKKDAVSKRLAEEIDFAKHIKNSKKGSPFASHRLSTHPPLYPPSGLKGPGPV